MNPGEQNNYPLGQPGPIMSGPATPPPSSASTPRRRTSYSNSSAARSAQFTEFQAAQRVASDPKTPKFFSEAMTENSFASAEPPKRRRRIMPFVIGGLAIVAAIIMFLAFAPILPSESRPTQVSNEEFAKDFHKFLNYIYKGTSLEEMTAEPSATEPIYAVDAAAQYSLYREYMGKLDSKATTLLSQVPGTSYSEEVKSQLSVYIETVIAWIRRAQLAEYQTTVMKVFTEKGEAAAKKEIEANYKPLLNSKNGNISSAGASMQESLEYQLKIYVALKNNGCSIETPSDDCMDYFNNSDELMAYDRQSIESAKEAIELISIEFKTQTNNTWKYAQEVKSQQ